MGCETTGDTRQASRDSWDSFRVLDMIQRPSWFSGCFWNFFGRFSTDSWNSLSMLETPLVIWNLCSSFRRLRFLLGLFRVPSGLPRFLQEFLKALQMLRGVLADQDSLKFSSVKLTSNLIEIETARLQFKEYVNVLATIKQEDGDKFLVLKRKFYPVEYLGAFGADASANAAPTPPQGASPAFRAPPPYRPPPEPAYRR